MKVIVIGSGFSGLSAASLLAKQGYKVTLLEKNETIGGRARRFSTQGFTFDMGPSWYWMPDVFERYFSLFGHTTSDFYELTRLSPSYTVVWHDGIDEIPADKEELYAFFEKYESGSSKKLEAFLKDAAFKYKVGMNDFVHQPALNILEFARFDLVKKAMGISLFTSISKVIRSNFTHPKLIELLEFPVLFLGATPQNTPALYSLMNHADMTLGTWYPQGGMHKIIEAFETIAKEQGVNILTNQEVLSVKEERGKLSHVITADKSYTCDVVVNSADYHHFEQQVLPEALRQYSPKYWKKKTLAPSSLLYYIGLDAKIPRLHHHNLFFDADFEAHAKEIYSTHEWPKDPLFYACIPSKTDSSVAPTGGENLFLLLPTSTMIDDTEEVKERYFELMANRILKHTGFDIRQHIVYFRSYAQQDFKKDYHAYRGNAYGLANTLKQTAFLKPKMKSKKIDNLFYTGQLTNPGPGVPPSIISGEVISKLVAQEYPL
ncbi:MAG: phytoene desaturase [Saprospiraceae bacterium]|nr:phytoene desaturase [Saprospiraceae bacterium]